MLGELAKLKKQINSMNRQCYVLETRNELNKLKEMVRKAEGEFNADMPCDGDSGGKNLDDYSWSDAVEDSDEDEFRPKEAKKKIKAELEPSSDEFKPKFKVGDSVQHVETGDKGIVSEILYSDVSGDGVEDDVSEYIIDWKDNTILDDMVEPEEIRRAYDEAWKDSLGL
jgi:hypothetical protein